MNINFSKYKILSVSNHPGGAGALLPVLTGLKAQKACCYAIATEFGYKHFQNAGIDCEKITEHIDISAAEKILLHYKPDLLLLGTSEQTKSGIKKLEPIFTVAGQKNNIPTIAMLDSWLGYKERFSLSDDFSLDALPDTICAMDKRAREEMIAAGLPGERIIVTGDARWDRLVDIYGRLKSTDRHELRRRLRIQPNKKILLFVSQPLSDRQIPEQTYDQKNILSDIITAINNGGLSAELELWIKPHPREKTDNFYWVYDRLAKENVRMLAAEFDNTDIYDTAFASDLAIGVFSVLLVEFSLIGLTVLSYQPDTPGSRKISMEYGVKTITSLKNIRDYLKAGFKIEPLRIQKGSVERIMGVITKVLSENKVAI